MEEDKHLKKGEDIEKSKPFLLLTTKHKERLLVTRAKNVSDKGLENLVTYDQQKE